MKSVHYPQETGKVLINGFNMSWKMKRSKGESCFGIQGSRIFELELRKNDYLVGKYNHGWEQRIPDEDEESALALAYILRTYGKEKTVRKKGGKNNE